MKYKLDARRLLCPMPVIRTQNKVEELSPGDTLEVVCTDHGVLNDIPAWCRINGHKERSPSSLKLANTKEQL
jgi:TusA-related sulfurtransferase